tara:strand:+ start:327 stop:977 length:651 start_codon:yes stop_codon:yes gene_type:complete
MISNNLKKRFYTSLVLLTLVVLILNFNFILVYSLIILGVISVLEFLNISKKIFKYRFRKIFYNSIFIMYIFIFCFLFFFFSNINGLKIILFILLFGCIASDIGGFIFGKLLKGPKLTKISPNKTYSGALGSIFFSALTISTLFFFYLEIFNYKIILISLITTIFCQLGDLVFSFLKRKAKIKDTGSLLPGHGGALDRLDGILLGLPFGFLSLILFN